MNTDNGIGSGVNSPYAGTVLMMDVALFSDDQKGMAVSPDATHRFAARGEVFASVAPPCFRAGHITLVNDHLAGRA